VLIAMTLMTALAGAVAPAAHADNTYYYVDCSRATNGNGTLNSRGTT
jgi:hypothetical protein